MRRIIFCCLVMMVRSVTSDGLRYRPQIPLADLHQKKVQRAEEAIVDKITAEEEAFPSEEKEISREDYTQEEINIEQTTVTKPTPKRHILKKRIKKGSKRQPVKKQKPICGAEPLTSLDTSCEQPTTCKPVDENIADQEDGEIQTTCNTVGISVPSFKQIITSSILRDRQIKSKTKSNDNKGDRAQKPIRAEVKEVKKKEQKEGKGPTRRPLRQKKRRQPMNRPKQNPGILPVLEVHYSGEFSSTSTYAPYPSGFTPTMEETPYENYHCGKIAHCVIRPWATQPTQPTKPKTTTTHTTSTTEAIGRKGKDKSDEEYELSDYQFD